MLAEISLIVTIIRNCNSLGHHIGQLATHSTTNPSTQPSFHPKPSQNLKSTPRAHAHNPRIRSKFLLTVKAGQEPKAWQDGIPLSVLPQRPSHSSLFRMSMPPQWLLLNASWQVFSDGMRSAAGAGDAVVRERTPSMAASEVEKYILL